MIIGNSKLPRAFREKTGKELGFVYYYEKPACMRNRAFFSWLKRFDSYIGKPSGRDAYSSVDNCEAQWKPETLPDLDNAEDKLLSKNITSEIQPLKAGIIEAMKRQYRKSNINNVISLLDCDTKNIYNASQLQGMIRMVTVWNDLSSDNIINCWQHTKLLEKYDGVEPLIYLTQLECLRMRN